MYRSYVRAAISGMALLTISATVHADNDEPSEWQKKIATAQSIGALGSNLFGDSTNYYNGATTFTVTDVDLPGNSALPVRLARTITAAQREDSGTPGLLADWEVDVPYMSGVYSAQDGWTPSNRCSATGRMIPTRAVWQQMRLQVTRRGLCSARQIAVLVTSKTSMRIPLRMRLEDMSTSS